MLVGNVDKMSHFVKGWALDTSDLSKAIIVVVLINGTTYLKLPCDEAREDVSAVYGKYHSGFSASIEDGLVNEVNDVKIQFEFNGKILSNGEGLVGRRNLVLKGADGWLFLQNDTNNGLQQITGKLSLSQKEVLSFAKIQFIREKMFSGLGIAFHAVLLADKGVVCKSKLPDLYQVSPQRNAMLCLSQCELLGVKSISYMDFKNETDLPFYMTDNHLNSFGNLLLFEHICLRLGLPINTIRAMLTESVEEVVGDLGAKLTPQVNEKSKHLMFCKSNLSVLYDKVATALEERSQLTGTTALVQNNSPIVEAKVILYGTSSAYKSFYWFSNYFSETMFIWSNSLDIEVISKYRPNYVIFILSERFIGPLFDDFNFSIST